MPPTDTLPSGWIVLVAALPVISLLTLLNLRKNAGPLWLRWDHVLCPPWRLADLFGLGFLAATAVLLFYPLTPVVVLFGALWLAQGRRFDLLAFWKLSPAHFNPLEGLYLYLACLLPVGILALGSTLLSQRFGLEDLLQSPVREILETSETSRLFFFLAAAVFIAPLWEEIVFRGVLYPFCKARLGRWPALVLTGFLFSAIHAHLPSLLPLALLGIVLGLAYERSGSLWSPILLHTFFNLGTSLNLLLLRLHETP